eukprot:3331130-Prymnesium_polylepis.1
MREARPASQVRASPPPKTSGRRARPGHTRWSHFGLCGGRREHLCVPPGRDKGGRSALGRRGLAHLDFPQRAAGEREALADLGCGAERGAHFHADPSPARVDRKQRQRAHHVHDRRDRAAVQRAIVVRERLGDLERALHRAVAYGCADHALLQAAVEAASAPLPTAAHSERVSTMLSSLDVLMHQMRAERARIGRAARLSRRRGQLSR